MGVKLAWQLAVPSVDPGSSVHGELAKVPDAPDSVKMIDPAGVSEVPAFEGLSVTVAVHVDAWFTTTRLAHEMVVMVRRRFAVMLAGWLGGLEE